MSNISLVKIYFVALCLFISSCDRQSIKGTNSSRTSIIKKKLSKDNDSASAVSLSSWKIDNICSSDGNLLPGLLPNYNETLKPFLANNCESCHGQQGGRADIGLSENSVLSELGNPQSSLLMRSAAAVVSGKMPPTLPNPLKQNGPEIKCYKQIMERWSSLGYPADAASAAAASANQINLNNPTWHGQIKPILDQYCTSCHSSAFSSGGVSFSEYRDDTAFWALVLESVKTGMMPKEGSYANFNSGSVTQTFEKWIANGRPMGEERGESQRFTVTFPSGEGATAPTQFIINGLCTVGDTINLRGEGENQSFNCNGSFSFLVYNAQLGDRRYELSVAGIASSAVLANVRITAPTALASTSIMQDLTQTCSTTPQAAPNKALLRLTRQQYINTLKSLFASSDWSSVSAQAAVAGAIAVVPFESTEDGLAKYIRFKKFDQQLTSQHLQAYHQVSSALSSYLTKSDTSIDLSRRFFGSCYPSGTGAVTDSCLTNWLNTFPSTAWRRSVSSSEIAALRSLFTASGGGKRGLKNVVYRVLMSPSFSHILLNAGTLSNGIYRLNDEELAASLSYLLTNAPPTAGLRLLAQQGDLTRDPGGINRAIAEIRQSAGPEMEEAFLEFSHEWLGVEEVPMQAGKRTEILLTEYANSAEGRGQFARDSIEEFNEYVTQKVFTEGVNYSGFLSSDDFFGNTAALASRVGSAPWATGSPAPKSAQLKGILSRPALLLNGSADTNPFARGGRIFKHVLCGEFPQNAAPPMDLAPPEPPGGRVSRRFLFESIVPSNSSCFGSCHRFINGFGFAFEDYDGLGKFRQNKQERTFDENDNLLEPLPLNTIAEVDLLKDRRAVIGAHDLVAKIDSSKAAHLCFTKQYFRYALASKETDKDSCTIKDAFAASDTSMMEVMRKILGSQSFLTRKLN